MKKRKISLIAIRFSALVSIMILLVMLVMSNLILNLTKRSFLKEMDIRAEFFARNAREALFPKIDQLRLYFLVQEMVKEKAILYAMVLNNKGIILSHNLKEKIGTADNSEVGVNASLAEELIGQPYKDDRGNRLYDVTVPIKVGSGKMEKKVGGVRIGYSEESISKALEQNRRKIILITLVMLAIGIVGTALVVLYMVKPINILADAAKEVGKGNLTQKVYIKRRDEIGQLATTFNEMVEGLKERDFIRNTFGKYVSTQIMDAILKGDLKLGGEKRKVTILLSDIRNFTRMSEKYPPESIVEFLNQYLTRMIGIVEKYDGKIDKFMGDAIFSVFGAPLAYMDDARRAINVAWEMKMKLVEFNQKLKSRNFDEIRIGIAIHTGEVVAGNIGSEQRQEYTVIGDTVNTASRIESLNKEWGTDILISQDTYDLVKDLAEVRKMPPIKVKGKEKEIQVYELIGIKEVIR
jgi:adenylate cyclase